MPTSMDFLTQKGCKAQGSLQPMGNWEMLSVGEMIFSKQEPRIAYIIKMISPEIIYKQVTIWTQ